MFFYVRVSSGATLCKQAERAKTVLSVRVYGHELDRVLKTKKTAFVNATGRGNFCADL